MTSTIEYRVRITGPKPSDTDEPFSIRSDKTIGDLVAALTEKFVL